MSARTRTVVLCGDSVVMSSIGASCRRAGLKVVPLDTHQADPAEPLRDLAADAILYDLAHPPADFVLQSLTQDPKRLLIGVDLDQDRMLVLSGQRERAVTTTDLVRVIETGRDSTPWQRLGQASFTHRGPVMAARWAALGARPRRQKLAFALAAITICTLLALFVVPSYPQGYAPLAGTAVGRLEPKLGMIFAEGILIGVLSLALAFSWSHRRPRREPSRPDGRTRKGGRTRDQALDGFIAQETSANRDLPKKENLK